MCIVLYLGSGMKLPTSQWSDENPRFRVLQLMESEEQVKRHFSKTYVYYLASYKKCGCGFEWDAQQDEKEVEEWSKEWEALPDDAKKEISWSPSDELELYKRKKQNNEDFVNFLKQVLQNTDDLEIYALMDEGNHDKEPTLSMIMTPEEIQARFTLSREEAGERILYKIVREK